jgi:hypothetical protein
MKLLPTLFVFFFCLSKGYSQEKKAYHIKDLNGIWFNMTDKFKYNEIQYVIFKDGNGVYLTYNSINNPKTPQIDIIENSCSFISRSDTLWKEQKDTGNQSDDFLLWGIPYKFYFDNIKDMEGSIELESWNIFNFRRVKLLPNNFIKILYNQGKIDKREYLKEFLNMNMREIIIPKSNIYSISHISTQMYLVKGNEVEILESKDEWLKIRYYGKKIIEGWIKKSDVE